MRSNLRFYALICAACLFAAAAPVYADKGGNGDPGNGHPPHPPGPPNPPPTPPGQDHVKAHPPQGVCTADDTTPIDLQGPDGQSGASHVAHTDFTKVDSAGNAVTSSSSASMMYFWYGSQFDYVLNAHGLDAGTQWTLTYQPEPLPSSGVVCLGNGTVNGGGQLHIANSLELNSNLPPNLDPTADPSTQPADALLALVLSADVNCSGGTMTAFIQNKYLWTKPRVRYIDTDLLPKTP